MDEMEWWVSRKQNSTAQCSTVQNSTNRKRYRVLPQLCTAGQGHWHITVCDYWTGTVSLTRHPYIGIGSRSLWRRLCNPLAHWRSQEVVGAFMFGGSTKKNLVCFDRRSMLENRGENNPFTSWLRPSVIGKLILHWHTYIVDLGCFYEVCLLNDNS